MLLMKKNIKFKRGKNMSNNNKGRRGETEKLSEAPKTLKTPGVQVWQHPAPGELIG